MSRYGAHVLFSIYSLYCTHIPLERFVMLELHRKKRGRMHGAIGLCGACLRGA